VHGQNKFGWSALHRAAIRNRADAAVCLLQSGASSNITDLAGRTPLHHACSLSSLDVVRKLCEWNALPDILDVSGLKCWGVSKSDSLLLPHLTSLSSMSASRSHVNDYPAASQCWFCVSTCQPCWIQTWCSLHRCGLSVTIVVLIGTEAEKAPKQGCANRVAATAAMHLQSLGPKVGKQRRG
jgi:hypothetical protein